MEQLKKVENEIYNLKKELRELEIRATEEENLERLNIQKKVSEFDSQLIYKIQHAEEKIETRQQIIQAIIKSFETSAQQEVRRT